MIEHIHCNCVQAWLLWNEGKTLELMDVCLDSSNMEPQVLRCIQVGLLCVQNLPADRPSMSSIVFMLDNEEAILPRPKQPGFYIGRSCEGDDEGCHTENAVTLTMPAGR